MDYEELKTAREYAVCKHNDLIQKSRYSMSATEQKIIWYLISKIKRTDEELKTYEFHINEFCEICGIETNNGGNYAYLKSVILKLRNREFWIKISPTTETTAGWIEKPVINYRSGTIKLKLDEFLKPYLLDLHDLYSTLDFEVALVLTGKYAIRLYELLKSYEGLSGRKVRFTIDGLKLKLNAEKYKTFNDFKKNVLDKSLKEIDQYANFSVSYKLEKTGRSYSHIEFTMADKKPMKKYLTKVAIDDKFNKKSKEGQISFTEASV